MRITFAIQRFDPEAGSAPRPQEFRLDVPWRGSTVLDALFEIQHTLDPTLAFRASCRSAICGSCSMVINGRHTLACKTLVRTQVEQYGPRIDIGPMKNMPVLKDLAVDMRPFWHKILAVTPWVITETDAGTPVPQPPATLTKETRNWLHNADACIMCGACVSACNSLEVSAGFLGPAALAKAYRFLADPRDRAHKPRLEKLVQPDGIWDCTRCNFCVEVCPKDVQPMEQIVRLRRAAIAEGLTDTIGASHITSFVDVVRDEGRLNEGRLPLQMLWRHPIELMTTLPLAVKMFVRGKVPFLWHPPIQTIKEVRRLFSHWLKRSTWAS